MNPADIADIIQAIVQVGLLVVVVRNQTAMMRIVKDTWDLHTLPGVADKYGFGVVQLKADSAEATRILHEQIVKLNTTNIDGMKGVHDRLDHAYKLQVWVAEKLTGEEPPPTVGAL